MENEMKFPAMIYDVSTGKTNYSSSNIHDIVRGNLTDQRSISKTALDIGLDPSAVHYTVLMANKEKGESALAGEYELRAIINSCVSHLPFRMTILDNHCLFLFESDKTLSPEKNIRLIQKALEDVSKKITAKLGIKEIVFSIFDYPGTIFDIGRNYERCLQTIEMGRLLYPSESFLKYSDLGAFAWLNVQEDEIQMMSMGLKNLVDSPHYKEHLEILKVYLESRMNYSLTAKTLFMHINTVRKRIEEINDLINFDIEDPVNRLKLEILLKIMG